KLDAVRRRFPNERAEAAAFVRHYEDAAKIVAFEASLPSLEGYATVRTLADEMRSRGEIASLPDLKDASLRLDRGSRWTALRDAHAAIGPMYWGRRSSLDDACGTIRAWIAAAFA